ncbi:hypothetical protein [Soonwooa purpurea]
MDNRRLILLFVFSIFCFSCNNKEIPFDSKKWNEKTDGFYKYREQMVNDIITNHLNTESTYNQIVEKIGKPNYIEDSINISIAYFISEKYGLDIDPKESKTLIISFTKDSIFKKAELKHYKK